MIILNNKLYAALYAITTLSDIYVVFISYKFDIYTLPFKILLHLILLGSKLLLFCISYIHMTKIKAVVAIVGAMIFALLHDMITGFLFFYKYNVVLHEAGSSFSKGILVIETLRLFIHATRLVMISYVVVAFAASKEEMLL